MIYLLYNPLANNSKGEQDAREWARTNGVETEFVDLFDVDDMKKFFDGLPHEQLIILQPWSAA